jgi:hypothetical protein
MTTSPRPPVSGEPSSERLIAAIEREKRNTIRYPEDIGHDMGMAHAQDIVRREARATPPSLDVTEALHESLAAMVSISEPATTDFARGLKRERLDHAIGAARSALRLTSKEER